MTPKSSTQKNEDNASDSDYTPPVKKRVVNTVKNEKSKIYTELAESHVPIVCSSTNKTSCCGKLCGLQNSDDINHRFLNLLSDQMSFMSKKIDSIDSEIKAVKSSINNNTNKLSKKIKNVNIQTKYIAEKMDDLCSIINECSSMQSCGDCDDCCEEHDEEYACSEVNLQ
jgi:hypothetical protein